jgi:Na+/proline symporter
MISPLLIIGFIISYFLILLLMGYVTSRKASSDSYFLGNRASPWIMVAMGMIGDSLSGITYISVPGKVGPAHFSYLQIVLGYFVGYFIISHILLPLYYRLNLTSIYEYLLSRFGRITQKTGSLFFIVSRLLGAGGRLYLAANVIQFFVFDNLFETKVPFALSVSLILLLMLLYTYKGGIKTLVYTDTLQSLFLILGVVLSIIAITNQMDISLWEAAKRITASDMSETFMFDFKKSNFFFKDFIGGIFTAAAMTGLDQNMMQKNLSCRSLPEAQKNIFWFSISMVIVNIFFLALGALLYMYYDFSHIALPTNAETGAVITDRVFPNLALNHLGAFSGLVFILGLTAATFSSADSVLTTLTTSAYIDVLELDRNEKIPEEKKTRYRTLIHIGFTVVLWLIILVFKQLNKAALIDTILVVASYTYGPLLALFMIGLFTKVNLRDKWVPLACIAGPIVCYIMSLNSKTLFGDYQIGLELIIINAFITGMFLLLFKSPSLSKTI